MTDSTGPVDENAIADTEPITVPPVAMLTSTSRPSSPKDCEVAFMDTRFSVFSLVTRVCSRLANCAICAKNSRLLIGSSGS
ncbi:hypothetical protein D3C71_1625850 [compost metagenome]